MAQPTTPSSHHEELAALRASVERTYAAYLADLERLVNTDCGSYSKSGVDIIGRWTMEHLRAMGAASVCNHANDQDLGDTVVAEFSGTNPDGPTILCIGHMDTVFDPGTAEERPFAIQGGIATGPGVTDMKSGLLTGLYAIAAVREVLGGAATPTARLRCQSRRGDRVAGVDAPHPAARCRGRRVPGPRVCAREWRHRVLAQGDAGPGRHGDRPGGPCRRRTREGAQRDPRGGAASRSTCTRSTAAGRGSRSTSA